MEHSVYKSLSERGPRRRAYNHVSGRRRREGRTWRINETGEGSGGPRKNGRNTKKGPGRTKDAKKREGRTGVFLIWRGGWAGIVGWGAYRAQKGRKTQRERSGKRHERVRMTWELSFRPRKTQNKIRREDSCDGKVMTMGEIKRDQKNALNCCTGDAPEPQNR